MTQDDGAPRIEDCINQTCPWTGQPVSADALTRFEGHVVGFDRSDDRDAFERAANIAGAGPAPVRAAVRPVSAGHTVRLGDGTVGFCSPAHRDEFQRAVEALRACAPAAQERCGTLVRLVMPRQQYRQSFWHVVKRNGSWMMAQKTWAPISPMPGTSMKSSISG